MDIALNFASIIAVISIGLIIIRQSGIASFEGVGVTLYFVVLISGTFYVVVGNDYVKNMEFAFSNFIHACGLLSMLLGILTSRLVFPFKTKPTQDAHFERGKYFIGISIVMIIVGITFSISGYILADYSLFDIVFGNKSNYVVEKSSFGGWFDKGLSLFDIGVVLLILNINSKGARAFLLLLLIVMHLLLSQSRGGLLGILLMVFIGYLFFNKKNIRDLIGPIVVILISSFLLGGFAALQRQNGNENDELKSNFITLFLSRFEDRFGDGGLADGYSNIINRLYDNNYPHARGDVLVYSVISNVPSFIYNDKPMHPFRATGDLVYRDSPEKNYEDVSAFGLIAGSYYDFGFFSLMLYLYLFGIIIALSKCIFIYLDNIGFLYFIFIFMDGASNFIHGGIPNLLGGILLTSFFYALSLFIYHILMLIKKCLVLTVTRRHG